MDELQATRGIPELVKLSDLEVMALYQTHERAWLRTNYVYGARDGFTKDIAFIGVDIMDEMRTRNLLEGD